MRLPRFTTGTVMVVVALVAVDSAAVLTDLHPRAQFILNGSLPALNLLLVGILALLRRDSSRRFLIGFEVGGWAAFVVLCACYAAFPSLASAYFHHAYFRPTQWSIVQKTLPGTSAGSILEIRLGLLYSVHTVAVSGPELITALLTGIAAQFIPARRT
jgi:hypothetical protein